MTCGYDCDVRIFEGDESTEFSVSSDTLSAIACYRSSSGGGDLVAVGMDDHSVQIFQLDVSTVCICEIESCLRVRLIRVTTKN